MVWFKFAFLPCLLYYNHNIKLFITYHRYYIVMQIRHRTITPDQQQAVSTLLHNWAITNSSFGVFRRGLCLLATPGSLTTLRDLSDKPRRSADEEALLRFTLVHDHGRGYTSRRALDTEIASDILALLVEVEGHILHPRRNQEAVSSVFDRAVDMLFCGHHIPDFSDPIWRSDRFWPVVRSIVRAHSQPTLPASHPSPVPSGQLSLFVQP